MDTFEPAQLDELCPYLIENRELLKWTSLDKLKQDFASFRRKINQPNTRIKIEQGVSKELAVEKRRELADIFTTPSKAELTFKDIIDIRLCAYIRVLEFILREKGSISSPSIRTRLLDLVYKTTSIIDSFTHTEDTPDARWFFKHRVMKFLLRESLIYYWHHNDYISLKQLHHLRLDLLENRSLHIDEDDCYVILKDIIIPQLGIDEQECHRCVYCDEFSRNWADKCTYVVMMRSLVDRHESMLQRSIGFAMEQLHNVDKRNQAKRLLYSLFKVAHDRKEWRVINATLACLLSDPTIEMREFATRLLASLVSLNRSRDGPSCKILSEHFDILIEHLESSSDEIQGAYQHIWSFLLLGGLGRFKSGKYKLLREVISIYLKRTDRITQSGPSTREYQVISKQFYNLCLLIMPEVNNSTDHFDFNSTSNQLCDDLNLIMQKEAIPEIFGYFLKLSSKEYRDSLLDDESKNQFNLICSKAICLLVKQLSSETVRSSEKGWNRLVFHMTSRFPDEEERKSECMSSASYFNYCEILKEIHQYFYDPKRILEPQRCLWFLRVLGNVGLFTENEVNVKALESCLLRAIEINPRQRSQFFRGTFKMLNSTSPESLLHSAARLAYHENGPGRMMPYLERLYLPRNDIRGIQSRRMLLVSLCKHSIFPHNYASISKMADLLSELELAYKLRSEQGSSEEDVDFSLLPTCVELAFPTPFDDPNNPMYICEFAYFRDTIDYSCRKRPRELLSIAKQLSEDTNKRVGYYLSRYDKFDVCCSTKNIDIERVKFRCIDHKTSDQAEPQICPLLNRSQYYGHIKE